MYAGERDGLFWRLGWSVDAAAQTWFKITAVTWKLYKGLDWLGGRTKNNFEVSNQANEVRVLRFYREED